MKPDELREEVAIELEHLDRVTEELQSLCADVKDRAPSNREKAAAAAFLSQFYSGIENILKRISKFSGVAVSTGDMWHVELFKRFCDPPHSGFPVLFDRQLSSDLSPYRGFRHVMHHAYTFELDWERMREGILSVGDVYGRFKKGLHTYMSQLG